MDLSNIPHLNGFLQAAASSIDVEERACAQNFLLDERPPADAADLYGHYFGMGPVPDLDAWCERHGDYARDHLYLDAEESLRPWTFRPENARNRISQIDRRLNLIRVEQAEWPCSLRGHAFEEVARQVDAFQNGDAAARDFLQALCDAWNAERDLRPAYVTTEIQVEDILADGVEDWAVRLRDRLGLGHMDPGPSGRPIEILLMRYPVAEVVELLSGEGHPTIPTVLDGAMSCYFFPSPLPKPEATEAPLYGRTVNLTSVASENDYEMGCELLNPRLSYRPEHFYRVGIIDEPVSMSLETVRGFHLPWVCLYAERDDFGAELFEADT